MGRFPSRFGLDRLGSTRPGAVEAPPRAAERDRRPESLIGKGSRWVCAPWGYTPRVSQRPAAMIQRLWTHRRSRSSHNTKAFILLYTT